MSRMSPYWAVCRTAPNHDRLAAECIVQRGFEIFTPKVRTKLGATPLFAGYLFVRIIDRWRVIDRTHGVLGLIKFGDQPARCPDDEIAALVTRADPDGVIRLPRAGANGTRLSFAKGAKVTIVAGPFAGFNGLHSGQWAREREIILLELLRSQRPVAVAAHMVAARG
jgi:transcriptional antiterminator RfaH